jgi:hypothetical protein
VSLAADIPPAGLPWWVYVGSFIVTVLIGWIAARSPVWLEKAKARIGIGKVTAAPSALANATAGEAVLREWRDATQAALDEAEADVDRLQERVRKLEAELYRRGWNGRLR